MLGAHKIMLNERSQTQKTTSCMQSTKTQMQSVLLEARVAGSLGGRE